MKTATRNSWIALVSVSVGAIALGVPVSAGGPGPTPPSLPGQLSCSDTTFGTAGNVASQTLGSGPYYCDFGVIGDTSMTLSRGVTSLDAIVVGGGAGGGAGTGTTGGGGGGGAGAVVGQSGVAVTAGALTSIVIGSGGAGGTANGGAGTSGGSSSAIGLTAGGGAGGAGGATGTGGDAGGSNSGGTAATSVSPVNGISVTAGKVGGGGGGSGSAGAVGSSTGRAGNGGAGTTPVVGLFSANTIAYSAGGGGGAAVPVSGGVPVFPNTLGEGTLDGAVIIGGSGGNANQAVCYTGSTCNASDPSARFEQTAYSAAANTGGGGGGGVSSTAGGIGGSGGSGVVRLRYQLPAQIRYIVDVTTGWESLGAYGASATIAGDTDPTSGYQITNPGFTFAGWSTSQSATTVDYVQGDTVTRSQYLPLYPVWQPNGATAPSGLTAGTVTSSSGTFSWAAASPSAGTTYQLAYRVGNAGTWTAGSSTSATTGSLALPAGSTVNVQVVATFAGGGSLASPSISVIVPAASGGGSTPTPTPTPSPTATPSVTPTPAPTATPTPGSTVMPVGPLAPALPGSNPAIPATGLPLGTSVMLVNGSVQPVTVQPRVVDTPVGDSEETGLTMTGPGFSMTLAGLGSNGKPLGLTSDGALVLEADRRAAVEGAGFQPDTDVNLYIFSEPRYLGTVRTRADGSFDGSVPLPLDVPAGRHTLQSNGFTPDGAVRSLSLGVQLNEPVADKQPAGKRKVASAVIHFADSSAVLDVQARRTLNRMLARIPNKAERIRVVGFVQPGGPSWNDESLSVQRARAVATYLRSSGLKGTYRVDGRGVAKSSGPVARRVAVTVSYVTR